MRIPATPACEHARLALLERSALLDTPPEIEFDRIVNLAAELFSVPIALVSLVDSKRQWFKAKIGLEACETGRDISFCGHVVAIGHMLVIPNAMLDERFADNPLVTGGPQIRFYAGAPIRLDDTHIIGTLCLIDSQPRDFDHTAQQRLQALADTVAELVRKRLSLLLLKRRSELLLTINEAQSSFLLDRDMTSACLSILQPLLALSQCKLGLIASSPLSSASDQSLAISALINRHSAAMPWLAPLILHDGEGNERLLIHDNLFGHAMKHGKAMVINHPGQEPSGLVTQHPLLILPCALHDQTLGILVLCDPPASFDDEIIEQLGSLTDSIGTLLHVRNLELARLAAEEEMANQAKQDPLTGLLNRRAFLDQCQQALQMFKRYHTRFSMLMLDIDFFKSINDLLGHAAGDEALKELSLLLRLQLRETDIISRWGGEEFCVLLPHEDENRALQLAERLRLAIARHPLLWQGKAFKITTSIGVASINPEGESIDSLLSRADNAMYNAKHNGRNCCHLSAI